MKKNSSKSKQIKKPQKSKKTHKKKNINIQGQPRHRDYPLGAKYDCESSYGAFVCSTKNQDLTHKQMLALRKRITSKNMRRKFCTRSNPYLQLTKKPSEVRMGKGRGVKISRTVNPLVYGSIICAVPITLRFRKPDLAGRSVYNTFVRAKRKLPPSYRVYRMDI
jgi:ribosomal protein L16/L10AE